MVFKPNPLTKLPPQSISPLIRAGRWGALVLGITYGRMRYNYLANKEAPIQEEHDKWKKARKDRIAREWKQFETEQMDDIKAEVAGHPPAVKHEMHID